MAGKTAALPKFATGLNPVKASFTQRGVRLRGLMEQAPSGWTSGYVAHDPLPRALKMHDFGYRDDELTYRNGVLDDTALVAPVRLLSREGSQAVAEVCRDLESRALGSSFIISRRLRGADLISPFLYNMLRDRAFLLRLSRIAGVPLIPHPVRNATAQINYYDAEPGKKDEVGKWHTDGMDYVFTMLLTDPSEFEGGQFHYFLGRSDAFSPESASPEDVRIAPLSAVGDTVFARGSRVYHGVGPLERGRRMVLTISLFSPAFADRDSNTFAHVAADDGIPQTVPDWLRLKWPTRNPFRDYALRTGSPVVTWHDLTEEDGQKAATARPR